MKKQQKTMSIKVCKFWLSCVDLNRYGQTKQKSFYDTFLLKASFVHRVSGHGMHVYVYCFS